MPAQRLTKRIKEQITSHLLGDKFDKRTEINDAKEYEISDLAYEVYANKSEREALEALPKRMQQTADGLSVAVMGQREFFHFGPYTDKGGYPERVVGEDAGENRWQTCDKLSLNTRTATGKAKRLAQMVSDYRKEREAIKTERRALEVKIEGALSGITTRKRLIESWPELEPTLDRIWPEESPTVVKTAALAVKYDELNSELELPEVKKAKDKKGTAA